MEAPIVLERRDGVLVIHLNRSDQRNAINRDMSLRLAEAMDLLDSDPTLRVGVLTGYGDHFCAGMDLKGFGAGESIEVSGRGIGGITRGGPKKLLIAAVEGYAIAGGFEVVLACDLVVASETAQFAFPEVARGLIAGSGGIIRLVRRMPEVIAAEVVFTGRRLSAEDAHRWGLINRLAAKGDALTEALELATAISKGAPLALASSKQVLRAAAELTGPAAWRLQDELLARVLSSSDAKEGAAAFREKREPEWGAE